MPAREFPVRPDLRQLKQQAKDLLRALRRGDPAALAEFAEFHPPPADAATATLAGAQLALARSYGIASWPRLVHACRMTEAIWNDDADAVRELIRMRPELLHEDARGVPGNWGPPLSYAANLGRDRIVELLHQLGAADIERAFQRACLQGQLATARRLHMLGARPQPGSVMGPCETLNADGLALLLALGAEPTDAGGNPLAPVAMVLQTYSRSPDGKHRCLELLAERGVALPDTPPMALHRGRIDLLESHLRRDPRLLTRTFSHAEIYPPELGCDADESLALHGAPLAGGTLMHLCVDFDEIEIARWMLTQAADASARAAIANARAAMDAAGFGGHTPLYGCVVSQPYRVGRRRDDNFARLLLDHGADPQVRASLRKRLRFVADETEHEYRNVTPREFGERFHEPDWVSPAVMRLLV